MITVGAKLFFGLTFFALVAAVVLGLTTGGTVLGAGAFAWAGPVGDQFGYTLLVGIAATSFFCGVVTTAFRDADLEAVSALVGDEIPAVAPPARPSPWPLLGALGAAASAVGLVFGAIVVGIGVALVAVAALGAALR